MTQDKILADCHQLVDFAVLLFKMQTTQHGCHAATTAVKLPTRLSILLAIRVQAGLAENLSCDVELCVMPCHAVFMRHHSGLPNAEQLCVVLGWAGLGRALLQKH